MQINRRALYNSLRMNWVLDPSLAVEAWQVEDYRSLPLDEILERLETIKIPFDKYSFMGLADHFDTPEDLVDELLEDFTGGTRVQDQVYLLIFELWRRLLPEKPCLSILCDELDLQIHLYDSHSTENAEGIQDAISNLQVILDENIDEGADPVEAFECIDIGCANDVESFLYDFIAEQIDHENYSYASELLDGFSDYVSDLKWFDFLRARLLLGSDPLETDQIVRRLIEETSVDSDLEFNLDLLSFLVRMGDKAAFERLLKQSVPLIQVEEDFQDLISISIDFYHRLDLEAVEHALQYILKHRKHIDLEKNFDLNDPQLNELMKIIS